MGDQNTPLTEADARQMIRRCGFGIPAKDSKKFRVEELAQLTRGEAADLFVDFKPKGFKPKSSEARAAHDKWVKYMFKRKKNLALQEKIVLFLHDHFATNFTDLDARIDSEKTSVRVLAEQNRTLRKNCLGSFKDLVKLINVDVAMMWFLDTVFNKKFEPNENYGRELLELFTLGVKDLNGSENYLQEDVIQVSRAFSGWVDDAFKAGKSFLDPFEHDTTAEFPGRGDKEIFGVTHPTQGHQVGGFVSPQSFIVGGEAENEIDEVVEIIFQHTDTDGENTVARHLTFKLLEYFCYEGPDKATVDAIIASSGFTTTWELKALLREIFVHDIFFETGAAPGASTKKSVRWPIDYVLGTLRALRVQPKGKELQLQGGNFNDVVELLQDMGQVVLEPPSVFGWDWEQAWISSVGLLARYEFVRDVTTSRDSKPFQPEKLIDITLTTAADIVDAVTDQLGVTDQLTAAQRQALIDFVLAGESEPLDLFDVDFREEKLHGLYALVLQSPAVVLY